MKLSYHDAAIILAHLRTFGPRHFSAAHERLGPDLADLFHWTREQLSNELGLTESAAAQTLDWESSVDLPKIYGLLARLDVDFVARGESGYPPLLEATQDAPIGLFRRGPLASLGRTISIVGSRDCTSYGEEVAYGLASSLARAGFTIISGLARGIDLAAHTAALSVGGRTAAILGCGVDIIYPLENADLFDRIRRGGSLLSEFPCGTGATRQNFPIRNRIISGIAEAIVVVESRSTGGSILSANCAFRQGRRVFAVPGKIDRETSHGCHDLIRRGAVLVRSVEDILEELSAMEGQELFAPGHSSIPGDGNLGRSEGRATSARERTTRRPRKSGPRYRNRDDLSTQQRTILRWLEDGEEASVEAIAAGVGLPTLEVAEILQYLKIEGLVVENLAGNFSLI